MKRFTALLLAALACASLWGCAPKAPAVSSQGDGSVSAGASSSGDVSVQPEVSVPEEVSKRDSIPFEEGQLYAVAHLGYQEEPKLDKVVQDLDSTDLPMHYLS